MRQTTTADTSILLCGLYYVVWTILLPRLGGYQIRQTVLVLEDGSVSHKLVNVPNGEVDAWDAKHDLSGRSVDSAGTSVDGAEFVDIEKA